MSQRKGNVLLWGLLILFIIGIAFILIGVFFPSGDSRTFSIVTGSSCSSAPLIMNGGQVNSTTLTINDNSTSTPPSTGGGGGGGGSPAATPEAIATENATLEAPAPAPESWTDNLGIPLYVFGAFIVLFLGGMFLAS